jgi:hypothetical protein
MKVMTIAEEILAYFSQEVGAKVNPKGQGGEAKLLIAERKSFLSKKKVEYSAKFRVDEDDRSVHFTETLKESGSGLSGGDMVDVGGGFTFAKETYRTGPGGRDGSLEAQGNLLGKKYAFTFDYGRIRAAVRAIAERHAYRFEYQVFPRGL